MPHLSLNGWTIPVLRGGKGKPLEVGGRDRTYTGSAVVDRRAIKRTFTYTTTALNEMVAEAVRGLVLGLGDVWPLDTDIYSGKGRSYVAATGTTHLSKTAADGSSVAEAEGDGTSVFVPAAKYTGALAIAPARKNLLSANKSSAESGVSLDFTGIGPGPGVASSETGHKLFGSKCIKVDVNTAGDGLRVETVTAAASHDYVVSAYVKPAASTGQTYKIRGIKNGGGVGSYSTYNLSAYGVAGIPSEGTWVRISAIITLGGGDNAVGIEIILDDGDTFDIFYVDGCQVEQAPVAGHVIPTPWTIGTAGATTIAAGDARLDPGVITEAPADVTVAFWLRALSTNQSATRYFFYASGSSSAAIVLYRAGSSGALTLLVQGASGSTTITYSPTWTNGWFHVTAVIRSNPETGETNLALYVNGALVASGNSANVPPLSNITAVQLGASPGPANSNLDGAVDDLVILPWAAPAAQIAALYNTGAAAVYPPKLTMAGDAIPQSSLSVVGQITAEDITPLNDGTAWRNNARRLEITLEEV